MFPVEHDNTGAACEGPAHLSANEAYKEIKRIYPDIKVVLLSGYSEDIFTGKDFKTTNTVFIHKPVSPSNLLRRVKDLLDGG